MIINAKARLLATEEVKYNSVKMHELANILKNGTLEFLAKKHNLTVDDIIEQIDTGNINLKKQFTQLVTKGIEEALRQMKIGNISVL